MTLTQKINIALIDGWSWLIRGSLEKLVVFYKGKDKEPDIRIISHGLLGFPCSVAISKEDYEEIKDLFENLDHTKELMDELAAKDTK